MNSLKWKLKQVPESEPVTIMKFIMRYIGRYHLWYYNFNIAKEAKTWLSCIHNWNGLHLCLYAVFVTHALQINANICNQFFKLMLKCSRHKEIYTAFVVDMMLDCSILLHGNIPFLQSGLIRLFLFIHHDYWVHILFRWYLISTIITPQNEKRYRINWFNKDFWTL